MFRLKFSMFCVIMIIVIIVVVVLTGSGKLLRKAHQANDKAVMQAYGFKPDMPESEIVAELMKLYQKLTEGKVAR